MNFFTEENRTNIYITETSDKPQRISKSELSKKDLRFYELYDYIDDDISPIEKLIRFKKDFITWSDEIKKMHPETSYHYFDPTFYYNNRLMVLGMFKKYYKHKTLNIEYSDKTESSFIESCPRSGLNYLRDDENEFECYGYDYSGYYMNILGNPDIEFYFPTKLGKLSTFETIEELIGLYKKKKLLYGMYKIKIESEHKDVCKVFTFSKNNTYTHYNLTFAFKYRILYKFKFSMVETKNNMYVYTSDKLIKSSEVFGEYCKILSDMKSKLPKNKIISHLSKSLWGYLTQYNRFFLTDDEIFERDDIGMKSDDKEFYILKHHNNNSVEIVNRTNLYKSEFGRLKAFLTAFCRDNISKLIIQNKLHDKIIRVQTDCVVLSEPFDFTKSKLNYNPIPEPKTTGTIFFVNNNEYYHKCHKCENYFKYNKLGCIDCN